MNLLLFLSWMCVVTIVAAAAGFGLVMGIWAALKFFPLRISGDYTRRTA